MKLLYNIAIVLSITFFTAMQTHGQDLPMACVGGSVTYGVKGFNGMSDFTWRIIDPDGIDLPASDFTIFGRGDSIQIFWKDTYKGGIYTFEVVEHSDFGCTGTPYTQDIILNTPTINIPFDGVPASFAACIGSQAALDPGEFKGYLWMPDNSTNRIFYTGTAGTYQVRLVNDTYSCTYNDIEAIINPLPTVDLGKDTFLYANQTLLLDVTNPDFDSYSWNGGQPLLQSTYLATGQAGKQTISVKVRDINGCENSDTINITAADYNHLRIPAAFTPNGDQINDKWYFPAPPEGFDQDIYNYFDDIEVRVFNRWGRLVWKSNGNFVAWDGKDLSGRPLPMDSYHYIITFKVTGKSYVYKGSITIVR